LWFTPGRGKNLRQSAAVTDERVEAAEARLAAAALRREQLKRRRTRLQAGEPATIDEVIEVLEATSSEQPAARRPPRSGDVGRREESA
jgi:hypothetical protein